MKRFIAVIMSVMMLTGLAIGTSAAGQILFTDDFNSGTLNPNNWIVEGNLYFIDDVTDSANPSLAAYNDGVICQMEYRYDYTSTPRLFTNAAISARINIREYDGDGGHSVGFWWRDNFSYVSENEGGTDKESLGAVWNLMYNDNEKQLQLLVDGEETPRATAPVSGVEVGDGDEYWFTIGWRVMPGRMTGYINNQKLIDYSSPEILATNGSPFLLINDDLYVAFDDIVVATADYNLFNESENFVTGGETTAPASETTTQKVQVTVTDEKGNAVTDDKGQVVTSESIVTEKPAPAETNKNGTAGGTATSTGDATFIVIAAMVATLGCAVVIKKATEK